MTEMERIDILCDIRDGKLKGKPLQDKINELERNGSLSSGKTGFDRLTDAQLNRDGIALLYEDAIGRRVFSRPYLEYLGEVAEKVYSADSSKKPTIVAKERSSQNSGINWRSIIPVILIAAAAICLIVWLVNSRRLK